VIIEDEIRAYDASEVVVTLLDYLKPNSTKKEIDWDSFVIPSERGENVEEYIKDMRDNDRL
jgi:hypothetical protein